MPRILAVRSGDTYNGDDWIGLKMRDASVVRGIGVLPVFAGFLGLLLLLGSLAGTWAREATSCSVERRRGRVGRGVLFPFSADLGPDIPSKAPSASSATRSRPGSTGPGIATRPAGCA